jgi:hypothetical protein
MRKFFSLLMVTALVAGFAAPAFAFPDKADKPKPTPEEVFKKLDANSDGSITEAEFVGKKEGDKAAKAKEVFAKRDTNKDGKITLEEFTAKKPK